MPIADWPREEKPREKLLLHGPATLSDAELLAIFLRTGVHGKTAVDLARELLGQFDGLRALLEADFTSLKQVRGLGQAKYVQFRAALELGRRYLEANLKRNAIFSGSQGMKDFLKARLRAYTHEVFACLFLDIHHRVISFEELFTGTIDSANVHPREVIKRALFHNSAAIVFAHNHPSGLAEPSQADRALTCRLQEALGLLDIRVVDHFIIGDKEVVSFAERGLI